MSERERWQGLGLARISGARVEVGDNATPYLWSRTALLNGAPQDYVTADSGCP